MTTDLPTVAIAAPADERIESLDLLGRRRIAGIVREVEEFGMRWIEVEAFNADGYLGTARINPRSIDSHHACSREVACRENDENIRAVSALVGPLSRAQMDAAHNRMHEASSSEIAARQLMYTIERRVQGSVRRGVVDHANDDTLAQLTWTVGVAANEHASERTQGTMERLLDTTMDLAALVASISDADIPF